MDTTYDSKLNTWISKERSGINLLNLVGSLMYDKGIELVLFRNQLLEIGVSELMNLFAYISLAINFFGRSQLNFGTAEPIESDGLDLPYKSI